MRLRLPAPTKKIGTGSGAALQLAAPSSSVSGSATLVAGTLSPKELGMQQILSVLTASVSPNTFFLVLGLALS